MKIKIEKLRKNELILCLEKEGFSISVLDNNNKKIKECFVFHYKDGRIIVTGWLDRG